jgi:GT2 family glycosyltransferase
MQCGVHTVNCGSATAGADTPEEIAQTVRRLSGKRYPKVAFLCGFCALLSRQALDKIGNLDEVKFPGYGVDGNMSLKLLDAGYKLSIADDVYVHHQSAASFGKGDRQTA